MLSILEGSGCLLSYIQTLMAQAPGVTPMGAKRAATSRRRHQTLPARLSCNPGVSGHGREVLFRRPWPNGVRRAYPARRRSTEDHRVNSAHHASHEIEPMQQRLFPASVGIRHNINRFPLLACSKEENNLIVRFPSGWTDSVGEIMSQGTQGLEPWKVFARVGRLLA